MNLLVRRGLRDRLGRYVATGLAVVLGVALAVGSLVLTDTLRSLLRTVSTTGGADLVVRTPATFATASSRQRLGEDVVARVLAVEGVTAAEGTIVGQAVTIGPDGEPSVGRFGSAVGAAWVDDPDLSPVRLLAGAAPAPGEVVIDDASAAELDVDVGATIGVVAAGPVARYVVAGIAEATGGGTLGLGTLTLLHPDDAERVLAPGPGLDSVLVAVDPAADIDAVTSALEAELGDGVEVVAAEDATRPPRVGFLPQLVTLFAGLGVAVGAFVVVNTFTMLVAQRVRELGLLRALGASGAQVRRLVLGEAVLLGVVAAALGAAAGVAVGWLLLRGAGAVGLQPPDGPLAVSWGRVLFGVGLGAVVTSAAALVPAIRAGRVTPITAMREDPPVARLAVVVRSGVAVALGLATVALLTWAVTGRFQSSEVAFRVAVGGAALLLATVIALGPLVVGPLAALVARPLRRVLGAPGGLARANADRQRGRSAATAAALMAGIALVTVAAVISSSARASVGGLLRDDLRADHVVEPIGDRDVTEDLAADLARRPELADVVAAKRLDVSIDDDADPMTAVDPAGLARMVDVEMAEGELASIGRGELVVSRQERTQRGWELGEELSVVFPSAGARTLRIGGVFDGPVFGPGGAPVNLLVAPTLLDDLGLDLGDRLVWTRSAVGVDAAAVDRALDEVLIEHPSVEWEDRAGYIAREVGQIEQILAVVGGLVALSVVIALLGIANTLLLGVLERTREIGLLRAVGMTRRQVRTMIQAEGAVLAALGAVMGVAVGLLLAAVFARTWRTQGFEVFLVPVPLLTAVVVGAVVTGALAATIPARRAARTDVLVAIGVDFSTTGAAR